MAKTAPAPEPADDTQPAEAPAKDLAVVTEADLFIRNEWRGIPHMECSHIYPSTGQRCVFDTFDETAMQAHVQWHLAGEPAENVIEES